MTEFPVAYSEAPDAAAVAGELAAGLGGGLGGGLGLLYLTDIYAEDFAAIVSTLKAKTGIETWVGTLGLGVIANARAAFDRPAAAAMILDIGSEAYRMIGRTPIPDRWPDELIRWAETVNPTCALVHADGTTPGLANLIETLAQRSGAYLVGGLTCSRTVQHQLAGDLGAGGVSGLLFSPDVPVTVGLTQGCSPLGPSHEVTAGEGNIIIEIDGRPALEVFKEDIGEMLARDLQRVAGYVHVAFPVSGADANADYLVRNLMAIDAQNNLLGVATEVAPGDRVMFVRRDPQSAQKDLQRMLSDVKKRLPGPARGAVYISCVARGPAMFGSESAEAEMISAGLGGVPVIGFYAGGEISNDRLYGYTGVLLSFG
ncbi:FIST N-terminal domain-containing protein [Thalassospiraceae bacterium LMO-JJ14]|nr:FIST N-terminal domain-containing protein [Thalassospiraceae bacterium LMO-JJ14]